MPLDNPDFEKFIQQIIEYKCTCCSKRFNNIRLIKNHILKEHSDKVELPETLSWKILNSSEDHLKRLEKFDNAITALDKTLRVEYLNSKIKDEEMTIESSIDVGGGILTVECKNSLIEQCVVIKEEDLEVELEMECETEELEAQNNSINKIDDIVHNLIETNYTESTDFLTPKNGMVYKKVKHRSNPLEAIVPRDTKKPEEIIDVNNILKCHYCNEVFTNLQKYQEHRKRENPCDECGKMFFSKHYLQTHKKLEHSNNPRERHQCNKCKKWFTTTSSLRFHILTHHMNIRKAQCHICGVKLTTNSGLKNHILSKHEKKKSFICEFCGRGFNIAFNRKRHIDAVHNRTHEVVCEICGVRFATRANLKDHMKIHLNQKPYLCFICKSEFRTSHQLKFHLKTHIRRNEISHIEPYYHDALDVVKKAKAKEREIALLSNA